MEEGVPGWALGSDHLGGPLTPSGYNPPFVYWGFSGLSANQQIVYAQGNKATQDLWQSYPLFLPPVFYLQMV